jgi:3-phosphoshikimate 1-carboxyvinyltransferase
MVAALSALGVRIRAENDVLVVTPGAPPPEEIVLDVRDSGTACRFLAAFAATMPGLRAILTGSDRLCERPIGGLVDALREMGAEIRYRGREGFPPLHIMGKAISGGSVAIPASESSQFASALLLAAPRFSAGITLSLTGRAVSRAYLGTTREALEVAGIRVFGGEQGFSIAAGARIETDTLLIPGDYSSAASLAAAVAIAGGTLRFSGLPWPSSQADARAFMVLERMGMEVRGDAHGVAVSGVARHPVEIDATDFPDAVPVLCAAAARVGGESVFSGVENLRIKESDRIAALEDLLRADGTASKFESGAFRVFGSRKTGPAGVYPTRADHRIVMAAALLSLSCGGFVESPRAVEKSYPDFFRDLFGI